jgi:hypothetical protein
MHIPPEVWGPFFWHTIHLVALGYPMDPSMAHKRAAKEFFEGLRFLIPCPICKDHYAQHLEKFPITPHLDKRVDLYRWTILLHNEVNKTLGKPEYPEAQSIEFYKRIGERGKSPVIKLDDFVAADSKSFVQGIGVGLIAAATVGGIWFMIEKT